MRTILILLLAASVFGFSGCGHHHQASRMDNAAERVASADWSKQETVTVTMSDFAYTPESLVFREGVPTRLVIENQGSQKHYFTAEDFFRAIATRKVQSNTDGEIKAPYFTAIEVYPGRSLDLYFVPVTRGTYPLRCTIPGHAELGMRGEIRIE
jgi:uncharacterized cupredoxin-like copper-binding protein